MTQVLPSHNFVFARGTTVEQPFIYATEDAAGVESVVDITGYMIRAQIRADFDATAVLVDSTTENGGFVITDAANGAFKWVIDDKLADVLTFDEGVYDIEFVLPSGDVMRFVQGGIGVNPEVTQ